MTTGDSPGDRPDGSSAGAAEGVPTSTRWDRTREAIPAGSVVQARRQPSVARIGAGRVLVASFATCYRGFVPLTVAAMAVLAPFYGLSVLMLRSVMSPVDTAYSQLDYLLLVLLAEIGAVVLHFLATQFTVAAVAHGAIRRRRGKRTRIAQSVGAALLRLPQIVGVSLVMTITVAFCFLPGLGAMLLHPGFAGIVLLVGLVVCPMVITAYCIAPAVAVLEPRGVMESMRRSAALTHGSRFRLFGVLAVISIVGVAAFLLVQGVVVRALVGDGSPWWIPSAAFFVELSVFTALRASAAGVIFFELKSQLEGADEDDLAAVFE